jgi:hypothetical protein
MDALPLFHRTKEKYLLRLRKFLDYHNFQGALELEHSLEKEKTMVFSGLYSFRKNVLITKK